MNNNMSFTKCICSVDLLLNFLRFPTGTGLKATAISNVKPFYSLIKKGKNGKSYRNIDDENMRKYKNMRKISGIYE